MVVGSKKGWIIRVIDALIVLLQITYGMSMLKVWLLDPIPVPYYLDIFLITFIVYILRFGFSFHLLTVKHKGFIWLFILIYAVDIIQNLFFNTTMAFARLVLLLDIILFMEYIYSMYLENRRVNDNPLMAVTKYYELYSIYNIAVVILCLVLIYIGVLSPRDNPMYENSLINSNVEVGGQYFFPGHLSLALAAQRGLTLLDIPVLTGLSHEPHVLFLIIGPCFFILLSRINARPLLSLLLYISFFAMLIIATSTTAILSFLVVFFVEQIYNLFIGERKYVNLLVLVVIIAFGAWFMSVGAGILNDVSLMMDEKIGAAQDEGSKGFSMSMLNYLVSPGSFLGRGNMPEGTGYQLGGQDIGYVTCILDILFALVFVIKTIKNVLSKDRRVHYFGMALLYFFIHNLKLSVQSFSFVYMSFFVVLLLIIDSEKEQMKSSKVIAN